MKPSTCLLLFLPLFCRAQEQQPQPLSPFPFEIALTTPDSVFTTSEKVLKKGKPTVIAFWLTTCMPCMMELKAYTDNYETWKKQADFNLFAISIDFPNRFRRIKEVYTEKKWPFPVYWDAKRAFNRIMPGELNGLPQVFIFDAEGKLAWQHKRYRPGDEQAVFAKVLELSTNKR